MRIKSISTLIFVLFLLLGSYATAQQPNTTCNHCQKLKKERHKTLFSGGDFKANNIDYNDRSDTVDVLHYDIDFKYINFSPGAIEAATTLHFTPKMNNVGHLTMDLLRLTVDSIKMAGNLLGYTYNDTTLVAIFGSPINIGDTATLTVYYRGQPQPDFMWGGFYFQNGYGYNLGVGFSANPHTFGRVWYPCFDNFVERATYTFTITTPSTKTSHCNGILMSDVVNGGERIRVWQMNTPIPSYLSCVAAADYSTVHQTFTGINGAIPVELVAVPADTVGVKNSFVNLSQALAAYEYWFGPYRWDKIGYSMVPFNAGAMEHATNIAYPRSFANGSLTYETIVMHELSHHWWGDLATCETAEDMWINEGMASYCEHLFLEYHYGHDRYITEVKNNHYSVMQSAHTSEGGYLAVSGIPHEYTYGDHVYKKGAAMAHNLRWYLGDTLFRTGMTAVLDSFGLNSLSSSQMRDKLTAETGVDMTDFFNDWIFSGGFSHFEIDSFAVTPATGLWEVTVRVQQKLKGAPAFHNNTPLQFTFYDDQWNRAEERALVSGEFDQVNFSLPFAPSVIIINEGHVLNQARLDVDKKLYSTGNNPLSYVQLPGFNVTSISDSAWIHAEYHPVAPDPIVSNLYNYQISSNRFWTVTGVWDSTFNADFRIEPSTLLDADLMAGSGLDSIILLWRPTPMSEWQEHPNYSKFVLGGFGYVKPLTILRGDYALGKGQMGLGVMETVSAADALPLRVYPNPAHKHLNIEIDLKTASQLVFELYDLQGRLLLSTPAAGYDSGKQTAGIFLGDLSVGAYLLEVKDEQGVLLGVEKVVVSK